MDTATKDWTYENQVGHRQHSHQPPSLPSNVAYSGRANGYGPVDVPRQRNGSSSASNTQVANGKPLPSNEPRNGRDRHLAQDRPPRERSRPNGAAGGKSGGSRICKKCDQPLTGQFVRALGGTYHLECFLCRVGISPIILFAILLIFLLGLRASCGFKILSRG